MRWWKARSPLPISWLLPAKASWKRCSAPVPPLSSPPSKELVWKGEHAYIGDGKIGPVTQKLYDTMTGMQWGKLPDTKGWIVPVEKKN